MRCASLTRNHHDYAAHTSRSRVSTRNSPEHDSRHTKHTHMLFFALCLVPHVRCDCMIPQTLTDRCVCKHTLYYSLVSFRLWYSEYSLCAQVLALWIREASLYSGNSMTC